MDDEISPAEVQELLESDSPRIVDIRPHAAFKQGHIPGSENIPFAELPDRVETLSDADHIVTVCPKGQASQQAARLIKSYEGTADARVESMEGGLSEWPGDLVAENGEAGTADEDEVPEAPF